MPVDRATSDAADSRNRSPPTSSSKSVRKREQEAFESELDQIQQRWYRDPYCRQDSQDVAPKMQMRNNLERAMCDRGFSHVRVQTVLNWALKCDGKFRTFESRTRRLNPKLRKVVSENEATASVLSDRRTQTRKDELQDGDRTSEYDDGEKMGEQEREILEELEAVVGKDAIIDSTDGGIMESSIVGKGKANKVVSVDVRAYTDYSSADYHRASRRFDVIYGGKEELYRLAEETKLALGRREQQQKVLPTTEIVIDGQVVEVEDPTFGLCVPKPNDSLDPEERRVRDQENKKKLDAWIHERQVASRRMGFDVHDTGFLQ